MHINKVSSQSFGSVFNTQHVDKIIKNNDLLSTELSGIKAAIHKEGLDSLDYVDININHSEEMGGFYGIISSKKLGTPQNPAYRCKVSLNHSDMDVFSSWARMWNNQFSPTELQRMKSQREALTKAVLDFVRHKKV